MAYTSPATAVTGTKMTPEFWNINIRDNVSYIYSSGTSSYASFSSTVSSFNQTNDLIEDLVFMPIINLGTAVAGKTYAVSLSQAKSMLLIEGGTAGTVTIPADSLTSGGTFSVGESINIAQMGTGQITITGMASAVPNGTVTLNYTPSNKLRTQYSVVSITKIGANEWLLMGDLL